ncbi:MAG: hypothetical protein IPN86_18810 [Saprospiraceae bacterium]|nr:hypothetical protein [Saprospiraceae bacterium]
MALLDAQMNVARFSNGGLFQAYSLVDIVGPGVGVFFVMSPHSPNMGPVGIKRQCQWDWYGSTM